MWRISAYRTIKILFLVFAIISSALLYITTDTYTKVMDAEVNIVPENGNIRIEDVFIPKIDNESNNARISVVFNVINPTGIDIYVYDISYQFYMNDKSNPMNFERPDTWDAWAVGLGGFTLGAEELYIKVPSKGSKSIHANMTVMGDTIRMENLNVTDSNGKYHPLILGSLRFTFKGLDVNEIVHNINYYSASGVLPKSTEGL